jgi:hypothetical protein
MIGLVWIPRNSSWREAPTETTRHMRALNSSMETTMEQSTVCCTVLITRDKLTRVLVNGGTLRNRYESSRHWSPNTESTDVSSSALEETDVPSSQVGIASTTNGYQPHHLEDLPSSSNELAPSARRATIAGILQRIRPCYLLVALGFLVIGGSLAVGLYYSIAKDRMGDGFTTAGWMIAVGTLILAAPMAKHYPHCKCWETSRYAVLCRICNAQV